MAFLLLHNYTDFIFDFKRKVKVFMFVLVLNYFALDDTYF
ncbi:hypothetical protein SACIG1612_2420 [Staphylococcus aureus subsp. aureus CIG1612]|nr:hypothetical protein SACIG1612_2420 [Staphylococcus aureus subsp. aureus CIG1612]